MTETASANRIREWRPVVGWPYEVSNDGQVRRAGAVLPLKQFSILGYHTVTLSRGMVRKKKKVHRLVAEAFIGPCPSDRHEVAHWDGDRTNAHVSNLRWATRSENCGDTVRHGRHNGRWTPDKTERDVADMRLLAAMGLRVAEISRAYGLQYGSVYKVVTNQTWRSAA